ncbi:MAG: ATP-binding cassette domain-containing protein [Candidatus Doudnabacteria bacterium]|nr:ATP-binding cassette domain-containing protein [Candidatus Doudnabacteria bacterium]MCA9387554.1 ATP-binding cassette domain-containing protein [Candidatus Andersenbacteria bacterium]
MPPLIQLKDVSKRYGPYEALKNVSFSVEPGEIVGFLGPNGAGKTTTMRILTGYIPPSEGTVTVGGVDVLDDSLASRSKIGYLPELNPLYVGMEVKPFLQFVARLKGVPKKDQDQHLAEIIQSTGLNKVAHKTISKLSRGYKQRVGLAQALVGDPDVLILDEPTVGLDPNQIVEIRDLIKKVGKEGKRAVILSTHILKEVTEVCDRVVIINEGKIVASDTPERLSKDLVGVERIHVRVKGSCDVAEKILTALPGAAAVSRPIACVDEDADDVYDFTVETAKGSDLRGEVSKAIVNADLTLIEVRIESIDLEEVFAKLTASTSSKKSNKN